MKKLKKILKLNYIVELITGLHIGAGTDEIKIGGIDAPVIKNPITNKPYIPGSSFKGKMRSQLEISDGVELEEKDEINKWFGLSAGKKGKGNITRVLVRDLGLEDESMKNFDELKNQGIGLMEEKAEVSIPRRSDDKKSSPRFIERVPAGIKFKGNIVLKIFEGDNEKKGKEMIEQSLKMMENDALGGSGSRGYGQVKIDNKNKWEEVKL